MTIFGAAIGAFAAGKFLGYGRWRCIIFSNFFVILAAILSLITNWNCFLFGRFFYGLSAGLFTVFCPKYINEVAPTEIKGPAGSFSEIFVTIGILLPAFISLFYK